MTERTFIVEVVLRWDEDDEIPDDSEDSVEDQLVSALGHSTAAEALAESLNCTVVLTLLKESE